MFAAEQRYSLCQAITEATADHATKTCASTGCTRRATSPSFTATIARKLVPPAQQWPPKFASVHLLQNVLESFHRCGVVEVGGLQYGCHYTGLVHSVSIHQIASCFSARVKGLCLFSTRDLVETSRVEDSGCGFGGTPSHALVCLTPPCPALEISKQASNLGCLFACLRACLI